MKIAELVATFPPYHGGMGFVCLHNALELAKRGHDVTVFTLDHGRERYEQDPAGVEVVRIKGCIQYGDAGVVPQLLWKLKGFDIVHLHYPFFGGAEYVYFASLLKGKKYFITYHMDVWGDTFIKKVALKFYEPFLSRKIIRRANAIGALSISHLKSSKVGSFLDYKNVLELPNGVDSDLFCPKKKDAYLSEKYGLNGKTVILFVGNMQPFKGLHLLINAVSNINDPNIVLLVVGGGYGLEKYQVQVKSMNIEDRVIFVGPQAPQGDLPKFYNLGDMLVLPSTHSEAFPLVVLEAMASGLPVIVSALPGPSGMVVEEVDGLIVPIGDQEALKVKILELVSNPDKRMKMGAAAREKVMSQYRWEVIGGRLETILNNIVQVQ